MDELADMEAAAEAVFGTLGFAQAKRDRKGAERTARRRRGSGRREQYNFRMTAEMKTDVMETIAATGMSPSEAFELHWPDWKAELRSRGNGR